MPRKSSRTQRLTTDEIATAGLAIADRDGLTGLTMRALGKDLGCDPMAIYRHVEDREALLSLVAAVAVAEMEIPDPDLDGRTWLLAVADNARATLYEHPNVAVLIGHSQLSAATGLELIDQVANRLDNGDAHGQLADRVNAYLGALVGYVTLELSPPPSRPRPAHIDPIGHPTLAAHAGQLLGHTFGLRSDRAEIVPLGGGFSLLMETVIDGLLP